MQSIETKFTLPGKNVEMMGSYKKSYNAQYKVLFRKINKIAY